MNQDSKEEERFQPTRRQERAARKHASWKDRSKYKKTDLSKRESLLKIEADKKLSKKSTLLKGRVLSILPEEITVEVEHIRYICTLRGALKKELTQHKNLITIGDWVFFERDERSQNSSAQGSIIQVAPRYSVLSRQDHFHRRQEQLIAANIDQVLITLSVVDPPLKPFLIDRYLIATYKGNMTPILLINKIDLLVPNSPEEALFHQVIQLYQGLHIPIIPLSIHTGIGIDLLKKHMQEKASVFSGQSGVGKSSLINALTGEQLSIGGMTKKTHKGTHTTTTARLVPLEFGGWCIDTPGIRSFGVWNLQKEDLLVCFPEIHTESTRCKFPNCSHIHEPDCAVQSAVEEGLISPLRFESYIKLLQELSSLFSG